MEKYKNFKLEVHEVGEYNGTRIYTSNNTPRESVAMMSFGGYIEMHPDAFRILKEKPDFLKRVYDHELEAGPGHGAHECEDTDIIAYLKEKGYDFGNLIK